MYICYMLQNVVAHLTKALVYLNLGIRNINHKVDSQWIDGWGTLDK